MVYLHLDSYDNAENTNLQLYSLQKAAEEWNALVQAVKDGTEGAGRLHERRVFILSCLGLSLTQLLGQNRPLPDKEKMDEPAGLLSSVLERTKTDRTRQKYLKRTLRDFLEYYGAVRHFGRNKDDRNYCIVDRLTLSELDRFRQMTIEIWDLIIAIYRQDKKNVLDEFPSPSIGSIIRFDELII